MATIYPYTQVNMLVNSITATTVVALNAGMQVSTTTFANSAGNLGAVILSPVQPTATNIEYKSGEQVLQITNITFRAAFGFDQGQVTCSGSGTDQGGKNLAPFAKQIASWAP